MPNNYPRNVPVVQNYPTDGLYKFSDVVPEASPGMKVFGFYVVRVPVGVNLFISFAQQKPFLSFQGNVFNFAAFGNCGVNDTGIYFRTDAMAAGDYFQIMWLYAPTEVVSAQ